MKKKLDLTPQLDIMSFIGIVVVGVFILCFTHLLDIKENLVRIGFVFVGAVSMCVLYYLYLKKLYKRGKRGN